MKKLIASLLIAAHLIGLAPVTARAAYPSVDPVGYHQFRAVKAKRVMVIRPKRWDVLADVNVERAVVLNGVYQAMDMLRFQGCDVHLYNSDVFSGASGNSALWRNAGDYYSLAIVLNPATVEAGFQRFINADSTNVQILVVGGIRANGAVGWSSNSDTTTRGFVDVTRGAFEASSSTQYAGLRAWTPTGLGSDTLWANNIPTGIRCTDATLAAMANVAAVYRMTHPFIAGSHDGAMWGARVNGTSDTSQARMPGADWATPKVPGTPDSLARAGELLGPVWRVEYANGRSTWFYKFCTSTTQNVQNPSLLWACIARFVDTPPIKWALDFDDVFDWNDTAYSRWRNSAAESSLAALRAVGVVPSNGVNPGNAPAYIGGTKPPYETTLSEAKTYAKSLNWIHHAHDSTSASIGGNLVGGYGGYPPGDNSNQGAIRTGEQQYGRRFASRYNPSQTNPGNWMAGGGRYGIVQRLQYSDSIRRVWSPGSELPPYLTFPANQMLPPNFKTRGNAAGYENQMTVDTASCPIDSVLWAFDYALNGRQTTGTGRIWLRSGAVSLWRNEALYADRDSFVASSLGNLPRDRYTVKVDGRTIEANILHSFNRGAAAVTVGPRASYVAATNYQTAWVLGLANRAWSGEYHNPLFGETYNSDANTLMASTVTSGARDFPARQATHIVYIHPGQFTNHVTTSGDVHVDIMLTGMIATMRVMDSIAGRKVTQCVPAWQVYD